MSDTLIKIDSLHRHYHMGTNVVKALDGVGLAIERGEFVAIVGASGSGKSTLMNIIGALDTPTTGSYALAGEHVNEYDDTRLSHLRNRRIGFVFQQFHLLHHLTVQENIELPLAYRGMPPEERAKRSQTMADRFGLGDRLHHHPYELSGGQAQRVAIMRALLGDPDILLLDEPTGALDSKTGLAIMELFHELHDQGMTIIMVTHDRELADQAARVVEISDGLITDDRIGSKRISGRMKPPAPIQSQHGGIGLRDIFRIGIQEGLFTHKMRSLLTMLGIIIGVSAVISMSSFSLGSKKKQADQIRALGSNLVKVIDRGLENEALNEARVAGSPGLNRLDMMALRKQVPGIIRMASSRQLKVRVHRGPIDYEANVFGIDGDYLSVNNLGLADGRMISHGDLQSAARVAVIGSGLAKDLGGDCIGQEIQLGRDTYTISGILASKHVDTRGLEATAANDHNRSIFIPLNTLLQRTVWLDLRSELDEILLELESEEQLFDAGVDIRRVIATRHQGVDDFELVIPLDLLKQKQQSQRLLDVLTLCISSISLVVGGIGIMNIMLASVTERLKEIGIRRAIGATQRDIRWQFLGESMIVSVTGGMLGVVMALLLVLVLGAALDIPPVFSVTTIAVAVIASTLTGLVFGYYPALQASRKDPVEVLRNE